MSEHNKETECCGSRSQVGGMETANKKRQDEKARYVKPVIFNSVNDVDKIEPRVNETVDIIKAAGGKIVSINSQLFGISPMNLIYNIIYEREQALPPTELTEEEK